MEWLQGLTDEMRTDKNKVINGVSPIFNLLMLDKNAPEKDEKFLHKTMHYPHFLRANYEYSLVVNIVCIKIVFSVCKIHIKR